MPIASHPTASASYGRPVLAPHPIVLAIALALGASGAQASSFTISSASTSSQTLGTGSGQTGTVTAAGSLTVSGNTVAVTISGDNATLTNLGTIKQTGTGRAIRDNTGVTGLTITNGSTTNSTALIQTADADVIQMNKSAASVTLNNYGSMISLNASAGGAQVVDFNAITSGYNIVNNYAGALMKAYNADVIRPGVNGVVYNAGTLLSIITDTKNGDGSDGIDMQTNSGAQITNDTTGIIEGGRHGITGGQTDSSSTFTASITNNAGGLIQGDNGSGINIDGYNANEVVTVTNYGTILGNGVTGDGDGIDVDGVVSIYNAGTIRSINSYSSSSTAQSEGITVGGGTIINAGTIEGDVASGNTNAVGRGITLAGIDSSGTAEAIYANSVITNLAGGLIKGQTDSAIAVDGPASGYTVTINNNAGATIQGGGSTNATIRTGADNDTINNAGIINGGSSGKAIDMGAGINTLTVTGGSASIVGDINGGTGSKNTMTINPGDGNGFTYSGAIAGFNLVEVQSGTVTLSGVSTYTGTTRISGGTLILEGANRLSASSALDLAGGTLLVSNVGSADGQTFASLALTGSSIIDLSSSTSLTFNSLSTVGSGKALTVLDFYAAISPTYALRLLGDYTTDATFLALIAATTIDGVAAVFSFDGTYTNITPVPLPPSLLLLLSGLALLMLTRHRALSGRVFQA